LKINAIKISNVLSYEYKENIDECDEIVFNKNLNILIGANGSGKSNFLEIISEIFKKVLFRECPFDVEDTIALQTQPKKDRIMTKASQAVPYSFEKNNKTPDKPFKIKINLELTDNDIQNLIFIQNNAADIQRFLNDYYHVGSNFTGIEVDAINSTPRIISYQFEETGEHISSNVTGDVNRFIFHYLQWFKYIQNCIIISNRLNHTDWPLLKNSFATLGSSRDYDQISSNIDLLEKDNVEENEWNKFRKRSLEKSIKSISEGEPIEFAYVKYKIASNYNRIREGLADTTKPNPEQKSPRDFLKEETFFGKLNEILNDHLQLELDIEKPNLNKLQYIIKFIQNKTELPLKQLSSGERGIIHLIFSIFGFDLKDGMMFIDEPEIHIHPQLQKKYLKIIQDAIIELDLQFIIATHSPVFVNENTVEGLLRFYKNDEGFTKIVKPTTIPIDMRNKIRMLNYTNSATAFFNNRIILVEGYPDKIFFNVFFNNYKRRKNIDFEDIEFLDMGSKDEFEKWRDFLNEFKIKPFLLADCDNLKNDAISGDYAKWNSLFPNKMLHKELSDLKNSTPQEITNIKNEINGLYSDEIFLLENGSMEDYFLLIRGLDPNTSPKPKSNGIVNYSVCSLDSWIDSNLSNDIVKELDNIFSKILT